MIKYGMTVDNVNMLIEKAKGKADGCYKMRGVAYRVRNGHITHFATHDSILEFCYGFTVVVGHPKSQYMDGVLKELKAI